MKKLNIYFTCPTEQILERYDLYSQIIEYIKSIGNLTYDWVESAHKDLKNNVTGSEDLYNQMKIQAISNSDIVIAEMSTKSVGVIYQVTIALQKSIPVLLLLPRENSVGDIRSIKSDWIIQKKYSDFKDASHEIFKFAHLHTNGKKVRINLVISANENEYLISEMKRQQKSKTNIIRQLIREKSKEVLETH